MTGRGGGIVVMLSSAVTFGTSGTLVKPLLEAGWSPSAAVTARILIAALVLAIPGIVSLRGRFTPLWRARWRVLLFAGVAVAGVQLLYFASVQRIPVSTALLIEYLAPVGLVLLAWGRTRRRPATAVLLGAVVAIGGLVLVIGPSGGGLDPLGVLFAALAMVGVGVYYVMGARPVEGVPAISMIAASLLVGGLLLALLGALRVLPFTATFADVPLGALGVPWWIPVVAVAVVSTAYAYVAGIAGIARLGERLASFVGLFEVVFAGVFAWLMLGEALTPLQLGGAVLILLGVLLVRREGTTAVVTPGSGDLPGASGRQLVSPDDPPVPGTVLRP